MRNRNSSPAKSLIQSATQTASAPESDSPQRGTGTPAGVHSPSAFSPPTCSASLSDFSTSNSPLPASSSLSQLSNFKSSDSSPSAPSAPLPLDLSAPSTSDSPSALSTQHSELGSALEYIASNPASEILAQFQSHFSSQSFTPENERDLKRLDLFLSIYAKLQNSAAFELVTSALKEIPQGPKRDKLFKELVRVLSIQDRSIARAFREQESIAREKRRIEREAKREQSQAARHAREDRAFNQREDHLTRKEQLAEIQLDAELYKRANLLREQVMKYTKPHSATQSLAVPSAPLAPLPLDPSAPSSQGVTDMSSPTSPSAIKNLKSEIASSLSALSTLHSALPPQGATASAQAIESHTGTAA